MSVGLFSSPNAIPILLLALVILGAVWIWLPTVQVGRKGIADPKVSLELEDTFRRTLGQALGSIAFLLTLSLSVSQFLETQASSRRDFDLKIRQELNKDFDDASALLKTNVEPSQLVQAISKLERVSLRTESEGFFIEPVQEQITNLVVQRTLQNSVETSEECQPRPSSIGVLSGNVGRPNRENFDALTLTIFKSLNRIAKASKRPLSLSHLHFDNLDMNDTIFAPRADFSQSSFLRSNLRDTSLVGANFAGGKFSDYDVPGFTPAIGQALNDRKLVEWQRYRCWIADFRGADLTDAHFEGAGLGGVDFRGATLRGAKFDGANISRADFSGTDVTQDQLKYTCANDRVIASINFQPPPCR